MKTDLLEALMVDCPGAMLPAGHAMATRGDLDGLQRWLNVVVAHQWNGMVHPNPNTIAPLKISVESNAKGQSFPVTAVATTATVLAEALAQSAERDLSPAEDRLLSTYLQGARQHVAHNVFRDELVWALCRRVDREGPIKVALAAFPPGVAGLLLDRLADKKNEYGLYSLDTAMNVAMSGKDSRPRAFLALCDHFGPPEAAKRFDANSTVGLSLSRLGGSLTDGLGTDMRKVWDGLLSGSRIIDGLRAVQAIERWRPVELNSPLAASKTRHAVAALHLQSSADQGLPWREDVVRFLLGDLSQVTDGSMCVKQTAAEMGCARQIGNPKELPDGATAQLLATALATHCAPALELLEPLARTLGAQPEILQLGRGPYYLTPNTRAKPADEHPTPLMYVVRGAAKSQPEDPSRLDDTLELLQRFGLLDRERSPGVRTAMHLVAQTPDIDRADWLVKLIDLGLDPEGLDASGRKPTVLMTDKADKDMWNNVLRSIRARDRASEVLAEIVADGSPTDAVDGHGGAASPAKRNRQP